MNIRPVVLALLAIAVTLAALPPTAGEAQDATLPGVRGSLYESPSAGWIVIVPEPEWTIADASSVTGRDLVHLVSSIGDGADHYFLSAADDGRGAQGCVQDTIDVLSGVYADREIEGWDQPEIRIDSFDPGEAMSRLRIVDPADPGLDRFVVIQCDQGDGDLLIAEAFLRSARDLESDAILPFVTPLWPGQGHTGRARGGGDATIPDNGVLRFLARGDSPTDSMTDFPFGCIDQESFARPPDPPPAGTGYFACDGQIANVDIVPATIDLADLALGCASGSDGEEPSTGCPVTPVRPSYAEILRAPADVDGSIITLQPGESADVVLWYALPEGEPPADILYLEPDRQVIAGPTFYSAGTGSRPKVRVGR